MRFALLLFATIASAQTRIASDFEIQQMEEQVARSKDFLSQLSGHLNLGDLRTTRNETTIARTEYAKALEIATSERLAARHASEITRYATATSYAALAEAKLGNAADAFSLSEEAIRYTSDSAKSWNLYANAMTALGKPAKAASASRNAIAIASRENDKLDLAIYQYSLASSLLELNRNVEAEKLLDRCRQRTAIADVRVASPRCRADRIIRDLFDGSRRASRLHLAAESVATAARAALRGPRRCRAAHASNTRTCSPTAAMIRPHSLRWRA